MSQSSLQDYSIVKTHVDSLKAQHALPDTTAAFYFFVLDAILRLQDAEIDDSITDSNYLKLTGRSAGHDRGVDAVYIDGNTSPPTVHIFNCKYTEVFAKLDSHFPAGEIDKLVSFFQSLMGEDSALEHDLNAVLFAKIQEIWSLFRTDVPRFQVHLCSNLYREVEDKENARLKRELAKFSYTSLHYHLMKDFVLMLTRKDKIPVAARFRGDGKLLFEKIDGDIRALILTVDARDLLRVVNADESLRMDVDVADFECLKAPGIMKDAFEDNVRLYLDQSSKINRNIKDTALSDLKSKFFYFNNGITITCDRFSYPANRYPLVTIQNLQVVNGGQTIHALFDAFCENPTGFKGIEVLCRIYETGNKELSTNIAEYTNSQNPVKSRDIRSNDYIQKKLEVELKALDFFYERKKGQHADKPKKKRIDAEKVGQALMAFYNDMPSEAKDKKAMIFAEKYEEVFNDTITASKVLLAVGLMDAIEQKKKAVRKALIEDAARYERDSFVLHASFYFMYAIKKLTGSSGDSVQQLMKAYPKAKGTIRRAVRKEQKTLKAHRESYNHRVFFKGNRPRQLIDEELERKGAR